METSIEKKLIFFKAKIRQTLDGLRPDIGDLRYRLYTSMVDECNDLDELCEMAELEMQIDLVKYTKQAITGKLEEKDVNIRDLRKVCYPPYDNIEAVEEEDETSASMNDPETLAMLAMALQKRLEEEPPEETRGAIGLDDDCLLTEEEQIANMLIQAEQDELNNEESLRDEYGDEPGENEEDDIEINLEDLYTETDEDTDDTDTDEHDDSSMIDGLSDKEIRYGADGEILQDGQEIGEEFDISVDGMEGLEGYLDVDSDDDTLDSESDEEIEIDLDSDDEDIIDDENDKQEDNEDEDDSEEGFSLDELELIPDSDIFIDEEELPEDEGDEDPFSDLEKISDEEIFVDEADDTEDEEDDFDIDALSDEDYFVDDEEDEEEETDDGDPFSDIALDEDEEDIPDDESPEDEDPFSDIALDEDDGEDEDESPDDEDPFSDITLDEDIEEDDESEDSTEDEDSFEIEGLDELEVPDDEPSKEEEDIIDFGGAPVKPVKRTDKPETKAVFTKGEHAAETQKIYDTYGKIADKLGFMSKRAVKHGTESIKKQVNTNDYYRRPKDDE